MGSSAARSAGGIGPYVWLERAGGLGMAFQKVAGPTAGKNRLHLDLGPPDPAGERQRVEALGGRVLSEYADGGFLVMADPEGTSSASSPTGPSTSMTKAGRAMSTE